MSVQPEARFTNRFIETKVIKSITRTGTIRFDDGWCFGGAPEHVLEQLTAGGSYLVESQNFSMITGIATYFVTTQNYICADQWLWHKSDAQLHAERSEWLMANRLRDEKILEDNREDWTRREAALPLALRRRLERFRANGGHEFELNGWGYELVVCELAELYSHTGGKDDDAIETFASKQGTSGNQHDYAKALSKHLTDDPADQDLVANSISALSPITGDGDYSGVKR